MLLALPDDHPVWSAEAAPLPVELTRAGVTGQPSADLLLQRLPDGQLNAYSPANYEKDDHGQFVEKYGKFVYNTRFGFSASRSYVQLEQAAPDSMLAFVIDGWTFVRRHSDRFVLMGDRLLSEWRPMPGIKVPAGLAPPAGGGGESLAMARNISDYRRVLFLRPSATVPPSGATCHLPRIGGVCLAEGGL